MTKPKSFLKECKICKETCDGKSPGCPQENKDLLEERRVSKMIYSRKWYKKNKKHHLTVAKT
jgi:hypothetical protein